MSSYTLSHLRELEAESIHIFREVAAEFEKPVLMYSVGKDSSVLVHLAQKAFAPGRVPFPLLHIDTTVKFSEMYSFRDQYVKDMGLDLIVHSNKEALGTMKRDAASWSCTLCANHLKTAALIEALKGHGFDVALGGARRDEEKSRAKERIYSFRDQEMQWDPKSQRPELWSLFNSRHAQGESFRVFPLSNWTEVDIWQYIREENIPIVPLYFAKKRPAIRRGGQVLMAGDMIQPLEGETVEELSIRFRTLGCQPCTGAVESTADTIEAIIEETLVTRTSERFNRAVDKESGEGSMEEKKREGYF